MIFKSQQVIRIPDSDSPEYDRYVGVPEGMTAQQAVTAFNAAVEKLGEDESGEGRGGDQLESILAALNMHPVEIHDTVEW